MATGLFNLKQVNQAISQGAWSGYIAPKWVEYLVVAGGGGASSGGAGAGGLLTGIVTVAAGASYSVTVGAGGASGITNSTAGANGVASAFGSISATGGGGSPYADSAANSGGSGAGAPSTSTSYFAGGQGVAGQGNAGGSASSIASPYPASGGGGAGTKGLNGTGSSTSAVAGNGGAGIASAISGTTVVYAGGGGGGLFGSANPGTGGVGGGGSAGASGGGAGVSGGANTGGGAGGGTGSTYAGGTGGSGIVVVRYPGNVQFYTGGTVTYSNGYIVHNFTANGTLAPTTPTVVSEYQISRSLRFNSADSAYLNRTPASATNRRTWTWSGWVKRSALRASLSDPATIFNAGGNGFLARFSYANQDQLEFYNFSSSAYQLEVITTAVFRDVSAWYHIVFALDTTQATNSNRFKVYVNGTQVTAFSTATYPSQNADLLVNNTSVHALGVLNGIGGYYSGYMTEVNFIDGQALTPTSFGYVNPATGVWTPAKYVGGYGTNGFYLNFSDNSNTTAATLGKDYSGNGNNWTPNNFSVTAGAGNDSLVDSPTSYGTDTGVGGTVRGNYATWNPLDKFTATTALSNGNLDFVLNTGAQPDETNAVATIALSSGKWYWECVWTSAVDAAPIFGVWDTISTTPVRNRGTSYFYGYLPNGNKFNSGTQTSYGTSWTTNDVIGIALDMDNGTLTFYKNGTSQGTAFSSLSGKTLLPIVVTTTGATNTTSTGTGNFGQRPFAYTAPSGFKALCTQNLPTPTIGATTATQAGKFFNPVLYTGNGGTQSVTGVGFQPDFSWIKTRSGTNGHAFEDAVRGAGKTLFSNETGAEFNFDSYFTAFTSDGFNLALGGGSFNTSSGSYVAWNWKANGSGSTNTAGSITSTVSANTTSGFSVVTYTGTGSAGATVGHGLGAVPSMVIVKNRGSAVAWAVWHTSIANTEYLVLNTAGAVATGATWWNSTTPTSTVFSIGTSTSTNTSATTYVAYAFASIAGYSAFGSFTGNASTDGPFVFTGFRPAYILLKNTDPSFGVNWVVIDIARNTSNVANRRLYPNLSDAEDPLSNAGIDILSNGFKIRTTDGALNGNGAKTIYAAFAESPFKYSLAR